MTTLERTFGGRPDIEIVRVYEEAFSAKAPGRPKFDELLEQIEAGAADGIIAWAPDRLARNSIDGGRVVYLLDRGVIRDLKFATYTFENNSQGKFMLQIMFGQSKYYSDALSDNVKRGNRTKVEKGWRPGVAPLGYLNDRQTRTIVSDPDNFANIKRIFDLALEGISPSRIWSIARTEWGLRTHRRRRIGGQLITLSGIYRILRNPFYAGLIEWGGRVYQGAHEAAISIDQFERVQILTSARTAPRPVRRSFPFTGQIRCGECRFMVTAEDKTNRHGSHYTYYHCTKRRTDYRCRQSCLPKADLERQIRTFVATISIPKDIHEWAVRQLADVRKAKDRGNEERRRALEHTLERARRSIENLTSLRIRDLIGDDEFCRERNRLETERVRLERTMAEAATGAGRFEPFTELISFRRRAVEWFVAGDDQTKRKIFEIVGSNPTLKDKIVSVRAKKPFHSTLDCRSLPSLLAAWEDVRTLWHERDPELLAIMEGIKAVKKRAGAD